MEIARLGAPSRGGHADGQVHVRGPRAATTTLNNFWAIGIRLQVLDTPKAQRQWHRW